MKRTHRSVRVDPELLATVEELARQHLVPVGFTDQVEAGLRLLVSHAIEEQTRQAARLVGVDEGRARRTFEKIHNRGSRG
jgi:predicted transcriptional regulator